MDNQGSTETARRAMLLVDSKLVAGFHIKPAPSAKERSNEKMKK